MSSADGAWARAGLEASTVRAQTAAKHPRPETVRSISKVDGPRRFRWCWCGGRLDGRGRRAGSRFGRRCRGGRRRAAERGPLPDRRIGRSRRRGKTLHRRRRGLHIDRQRRNLSRRNQCWRWRRTSRGTDTSEAPSVAHHSNGRSHTAHAENKAGGPYPAHRARLRPGRQSQGRSIRRRRQREARNDSNGSEFATGSCGGVELRAARPSWRRGNARCHAQSVDEGSRRREPRIGIAGARLLEPVLHGRREPRRAGA